MWLISHTFGKLSRVHLSNRYCAFRVKLCLKSNPILQVIRDYTNSGQAERVVIMADGCGLKIFLKVLNLHKKYSVVCISKVELLFKIRGPARVLVRPPPCPFKFPHWVSNFEQTELFELISINESIGMVAKQAHLF